MKRAKKTEKKAFIIDFRILFGALFVFIAAFVFIIVLSGLTGENESRTKTEPVNGQRINLLVTGFDADGMRTDLIMVASLETASKKADILLIPENTRMYVGGRYQKISAAHAITQNGRQNGVGGTVEAIRRLTAIELNYYIEFSSDSFIKFTDALGGIEFDVPQTMKYSDPLQNLDIDLKNGYQRLNGKKACDLIRFVSYKNGPEGRTALQSEFFAEFAAQKLNPKYIGMLPGLFRDIDINTNLTAKDAVSYANLLLFLDSSDISFHICPGHQEEQGVTYWIPDTEALKSLIRENFGCDPKNITANKPKKD